MTGLAGRADTADRHKAWALFIPLLLTGCGVGEAPPPPPPPPGDVIACAPEGEPLRPQCTLSRSGDTLIVRQADGAFRRLIRSGGTWVSADGVESVTVARAAAGLQATIGGWTYRLPAR